MINFISNYKEKIIFVISIFLLFVSFYYNEDGTGGGAKGDFEVTYGFILALQENLLADKILAKHDENYMPPEVKESMEQK